MRYSIVYIVTRPEIQERISVGLIVLNGDRAEVKTSSKKMKAAGMLLGQREYEFASRTVAGLRTNVKSAGDVEYLTRYSNNLIALSPLQTIDIDATEQNREWLFKNYVYDGAQKP